MTSHELRPDEAFAARVVGSILDAAVEPLDVPGAPPRTPDCEVIYPHGGRAPLEVTWVTERNAFQLEHLLAEIHHQLPAVGRHRWFANVSTVSELRRLTRTYAEIIRYFDDHGAHQWEDLPPWLVHENADVRWLAMSNASLTREMGQVEYDEPAPVVVFSAGTSAVWDDQTDGISPAIQHVLAEENVVDHVRKLLAYEADERHLFLFIDTTGIDSAAAFELMDITTAPSGKLVLPEGLTHLWICPRFGHSVLLWTDSQGWSVRFLEHPTGDVVAEA